MAVAGNGPVFIGSPEPPQTGHGISPSAKPISPDPLHSAQMLDSHRTPIVELPQAG